MEYRVRRLLLLLVVTVQIFAWTQSCFTESPVTKELVRGEVKMKERCRGLEVVRRCDWRARKPRGVIPKLETPAVYVIVHHTNTSSCHSPHTCARKMRRLQRAHLHNNWIDIGYHFVIGGDGKAYECRPWDRFGAPTTPKRRRDSVSVAFLGDFSAKCPSDVMVGALKSLLRSAAKSGHISKQYRVLGHRDTFCTSCPGDALHHVIRKWPRFQETTSAPCTN